MCYQIPKRANHPSLFIVTLNTQLCVLRTPVFMIMTVYTKQGKTSSARKI